MRILKGFRTYLFNAIAAIPPLIVEFAPLLNAPELRAVLPPHWLPWYSLAIVAVNIVLRSVTTTPPGKRL
ncbi:hypothetical protein [Rhizobium sp. CAU 1783]